MGASRWKNQKRDNREKRRLKEREVKTISMHVGLWGGRTRGQKVRELTGITLIGISLEVPLGDLEIVLVGDLVEGVLAAADELASIAVAVQ